MISIIRRGADGSLGQIKYAADKDALERLLTRDWVLSPSQSAPPFFILDHVESCFSETDRLGPPLDEASEIDWIATHLFTGNARRIVVEGVNLEWHKGASQILEASERRLCQGEVHHPNLFSAAKVIWSTYLNGRRVISVSDFQMRRSQSVNSRWLENGPTLSQLREPAEPEWETFGDRIKELDGRLKAAVTLALKEGRVLCSEERGSSAQLVHPALASLRSRKGERTFYFCFSGDLPNSWLAKFDTLPKRRSRATRWMIKTYQHFMDMERHATAEQLRKVAEAKFKLVPNAALTSWKMASKKLTVKKGRPVGDEIVEYHEIKTLK